MKGKYVIMAKYYGGSPAKLIGPVTLQADVYTNYGRANQTHRVLTFRLKKPSGVATIGEVEF